MPSRRNLHRQNGRSDEGDGALSEEFLLSVLPNTVEIHSISEETDLQDLWAGYGSVHSFTVSRTVSRGDGAGGHEEEEEETPLVVKRVRPPRDGDGISHTRKLRSYEVECTFYGRFASRVHAASSVVGCALPRAYHVEARCGGGEDPSFTVLMSDLRADFPVPDPFCVDNVRAEAALRWLAAFHAIFWEDEDVLSSCGGDGVKGSLWECGGYWHLDTRLEELDNLPLREWGWLKSGAHAIDRRMRAGPAFQTLCHGDFKSANLLFSSDGRECAAVDYQYVGRGYGMKDVVMLIVSSVDSRLVGYVKDGGGQDKLRYYHATLLQNLRSLGRVSRDRIDAYTFAVMMGHYELCLMDYVRFMAGWGFWGENCRFAQDRCRRISNEMKAEVKGSLSDEERWEEAIRRRYPSEE